MAEDEKGKSSTDKLKDVVSQLKEMEHYSRSNVEKLTEFWLLLEDEMKENALAEKMNDLLTCQNTFYELIQGVVEACEEKYADEEGDAG